MPRFRQLTTFSFRRTDGRQVLQEVPAQSQQLSRALSPLFAGFFIEDRGTIRVPPQSIRTGAHFAAPFAALFSLPLMGDN